MPKDLAYYLSLNYPIELVREEGSFVAAHPDLPGCAAIGETADEAIASLDDAREAWIAVGLQDNQFIPEPLPEKFSGRLSLRMPTALHAALAHQAHRQGVSLSQFIVTALAGAVGLAKGAEQARESEVEVLAQLAKDLRAVVEKMTTSTAETPGMPIMHRVPNVRPARVTTSVQATYLSIVTNRSVRSVT